MKLQYRIPLAIYSVWCIIAILLCKDGLYQMNIWTLVEILGMIALPLLVRPFFILGFAPIFPDTCYHLTHYWPAAADIPVASDNPVHYADAIRYNARTPLQGSLLPLTRLV